MISEEEFSLDYDDGYWEEQERYYPECATCGEPTWHLSLPLGMCPSCVVKLPEFKLNISFNQSKSKNYKKAIKMAAHFPGYEEAGTQHIIRFDDLEDYAMFREFLNPLLGLIVDWKSFRVEINGTGITSYHIICIKAELDKIYGKPFDMLNGYKSF